MAIVPTGTSRRTWPPCTRHTSMTIMQGCWEPSVAVTCAHRTAATCTSGGSATSAAIVEYQNRGTPHGHAMKRCKRPQQRFGRGSSRRGLVRRRQRPAVRQCGPRARIAGNTVGVLPSSVAACSPHRVPPAKQLQHLEVDRLQQLLQAGGRDGILAGQADAQQVGTCAVHSVMCTHTSNAGIAYSTGAPQEHKAHIATQVCRRST